MNELENKSLCILLMEDMRGNWADRQEKRVNSIREIAKELGWNKTVNLCDTYDYQDGRHFRRDFEFGGYDHPDFEVIRRLEGTSEKFKEMALSLLTYPEYRFEDYHQRQED